MSIMTGPTQAPTAPAPAAPDAAPKTGSQQRLLLIGGAGLALIVVAALAYFFLLSGSDTTAAGPTAALPAPQSSASAGPSTAAPADKPLRTFAGRTSRNPFKSLAPAPGSGSAGTGTGTATSTDSGTGTGTTPVTTAPTTSSVPLAVVLKSIKSDKSGATLTVKPEGKATKTYSPTIGATFATYFQLNGFLSDAKTGVAQCALLSYGDASFTLCKGASMTIK